MNLEWNVWTWAAARWLGIPDDIASTACTVQAGSDDALLGGTLAEQERNADLPEGER